MNQQEYAKRLDTSVRGIRHLNESLRKKNVPLITHQGETRISHDPAVIRAEATFFMDTAKAYLEQARGLLSYMYDGELGGYTQEEEIYMSMLPIEESQETEFDSSTEFPFLEA